MAGLVLAHLGRRVLLLNRSSARGRKVGEVLTPTAVAQLRAVGQVQLLTPGKHLPVVGGVSSWGRAGIVDREFSFDPRGTSWHLNRSIFDNDLLVAALTRGAKHHAGARFRRAQALMNGRGWKVEFDNLGEVTSSFVVDATGRASSFARHQGMRRRRHDRLIALTASAQLTSEFEFAIEAVASGWWYAAALLAGRAIVAYLTDADMIPAGSEPQRNFFHDKLDETTHIKSRVSVDPKVRTQTVAAQTEAIDAPIGSCWAAVGDAAASFDPLSSFGLTNALESGRLAGLAIDATLAGERGFIEAYGRHVRRRTEDSDILRSAYYGMEARWPRSPFWDRRRGWTSR
ncbi:hypothetical protein G6321_00053580 [Bradyrhizobium barranii subsp. barranii]|uniref:Flavin-dependent dehydrogenase n=2 Tax=Bradyrhizobium barranii TaxID=2992140 RepID=A0A9X9YTM1_9BRAD|nr:hypothetical protein G6321_00053580 [Bradyrhizobium barranii subsp. barranii]